MAGSALHRLRTIARPLVPRRYHAFATKLVGRVVAVALAGRRVCCPCCGARLRRFLVYPSLYCPRCGSYERHRLLVLQLRRRPGLLAPPLRLLQVSPDRPFEPLLRVDGIDRVSIDLDNPRVDVEMDVHELSFADCSFDVVLALHVLDAVADQPRALAELHRVLKPGGLGMFQVPLDQQSRLGANLKAAGFETEILRAVDLGSEAIVRHGLIPEEETYVGRKP
jgi:SAM-dependent methyltransferase